MQNKQIGHIILNSGTVKDIQQIVPNFPSNPTKETFIELGYKESTAMRYIYQLKKNSANKEIQEKANCIELKRAEDLKNVFQSTNANYDNILVDTCALGSEHGKNIIEEARQVTFIFAILEEMDKIKSMKKTIQKYTSEILKGSDKYLLSKFNGCSEEKYVDNILLQYLQILPKQIRPTLLTADRNLAIKAESLELNYICVEQNNMLKKNLGYGITLYKKNDELFIEYKGSYRLEIHRDKGVITCKTNQKVNVQQGEKLHLYEKVKTKIIEHIIDI